jgi:hypothetical protein
MKSKILVLCFAMAFLTACGGSTSGGDVTQPPDLTNADEGSIKLTAGAPVDAGSAQEILAVDYANSEVGSVVNITAGELAGISIEVGETIAGGTSLLITGEAGEQDPGRLSLEVSADPNLFFKGQMNVLGEEEVEGGSRTERVNGVDIVYHSSEREKGSTRVEDGGMFIETGDNVQVQAQVTIMSVEGEELLVLGYSRGSPSTFTAPSTGTYTYEGHTVLFHGEDSHTDPSSKMSVNFGTGIGTYSADNFSGDYGAADVAISLSSDINLNNIDGTISGSNGLISVGDTDGSIEIVGVMGTDNNAVAGAVVAEGASGVNGVVGGLFALPKKP